MSKRTYADKSNSPFKQMVICFGKYTDSDITESDYMDISPKWRRLLEERLKIDGQKCVLCGAAYQLQVHHRRYPPAWGLETTDDLVTLCDACHKKIHSKEI